MNWIAQKPYCDSKKIIDNEGCTHILVRESVVDKFLDTINVLVNIYDVKFVNNKIATVEIFQIELGASQ